VNTALSVLIVEDDAMIGLLLTEILQEMGHTVCGIVATEEDAVIGAARLQPGLMLVDVNLHEGSGVSAVRRILKSGATPCVFMSGEPVQVGWPTVPVLRKPFAEQELVVAIAHVVGPGVMTNALPPGPPHIVPIH
jgi:two-component system, response regulator PdtaR